ncbi:MAG: hypothetical protein OHK0021_04470 [Bryobacter sp.]
MNYREVEPGVYSLLFEGRQEQVFVEAVNGTLECLWRGRRYEIPLSDPRGWHASAGANHSASSAKVVSPMPGKVVRVLVEVGLSVEAGQGLVVVEAMKMQNELKSPIAGTVVQVKTEDGATVRANELLLLVEAHAG